MRRFAYRRLIVFIALLCQVVTAGVVHTPMAYAATAAQTTTAPSCHEHSHGVGTDEGGMAATAASHSTSGHSDDADKLGAHFGFCKSGSCHCTCAHPPAAFSALPFDSAFPPHAPLSLTYRVPPAQTRPTLLFRPPI